MSLTPDDLLKNDSEVVSMPAVFYELMQVIDDPDVSVEEIGRIIGNDPALTARLLRIVNSPFYGIPGKVETITHALSIVGTKQLSAMVLATCVMTRFAGIPERLVTMESFWSHSVACGLAARILAQMLREPNAEVFYVAGVMHDVGSLIFYKNIPDLAGEALLRCNNWGQSLIDAEREVIGFDHMEMGMVLAREWKLPERLAAIIGGHHHPLKVRDFTRDAAVVYLADYIAQGSQLGSSGEAHTPPLDLKAWQLLDLPAAALTSVPRQTLTLFRQTARLFLD
jgi:putative nucleotidyltransferase with HDIG domain